MLYFLINFTKIALFFVLALGAPWAQASGKIKHPKELSSVNARSYVAYDISTGSFLYGKNYNQKMPIASLTKVMTAMVVLDSNRKMSNYLKIESADLDKLKGTSSRLRVGEQYTRREMLQMALMSSENRASAALSRSFPGGRTAFVAAMNRKAKQLGMKNTRFVDPTGLSPNNVSTAYDIALMLRAADKYPLIRKYSTELSMVVSAKNSNRRLVFNNSNPLVKYEGWDIALSKTGYISEAGKCLAIKTKAGKKKKDVVLVTLGSQSSSARLSDMVKIRSAIR